jgi:hypothetical protein
LEAAGLPRQRMLPRLDRAPATSERDHAAAAAGVAAPALCAVSAAESLQASPHLRRDWAHPAHICAGTGVTPPTSAPGPGSPRPHLRREGLGSPPLTICMRPAALSAHAFGLGCKAFAPGGWARGRARAAMSSESRAMRPRALPHAHTHIDTRTHTHTHTRTHAHTHTRTHTCVLTHTHTRVHVCVCEYTCVCVRVRV